MHPNTEAEIYDMLFDIAQTETDEELLVQLQPGVKIELTNKESEAFEELNLIHFNFENGYFEGVEGSKMKFLPIQVLAHELGHLATHPSLTLETMLDIKQHEQGNIDNWENPIVKELIPGRELRKEWGGRYENE